MNKHITWSLLVLVAGCSSQTDLGSGNSQGGLSDQEAICERQSSLPCGTPVSECTEVFADQAQRAQEAGCTQEVDAMLACGRGLEFYCQDGQLAADGCAAEQELASECMFGSDHGACGGSMKGLPGQPEQECEAFCDDGGRVSCVGEETAVTCVCEAGPQAGHTFALLSCSALDAVFLTECYEPPSAGNPEACGGSGRVEENGRQSCDASCQSGAAVSCEGPVDGPVVCECEGSGRQFALTGCDELPSHAAGACQ